MNKVIDQSKKHISFLLNNFEEGGVERIFINLATELSTRGYTVSFICFKKNGGFLDQVPSNIQIIELNVKRAISSIPKLIYTLNKEKVDVLISAKHYINIVAALANKLSFHNTKLILSGHGMYHRKKIDPLPTLMKMFYPTADAIIAVSKGVAEDISKITNIPMSMIDVIYNPVITNHFIEKASNTSDLKVGSKEKLIVTVGRLSEEKDYKTLIMAFKTVVEKVPSKLIIVGEGPQRRELEKLITELNLQKHVELPGFKENPYDYMKKCDLFVLSSKTEGLPTVLIEALFFRKKIISTDCPSGPREILEGGKLGTLTPVGDYKFLSNAMLEALTNTTSDIKSDLREKAFEFSTEKTVYEYEKLINSL